MKPSDSILKKIYSCLGLLIVLFVFHANALAAEDITTEENKYVGVDACIDCHEDIVNIFKKNSKKAHSDKSIKKMRPKLTEAEYNGCLKCHTTGYGEASGFVSFTKTPELGMVGCESCHGMGYLHAQDPTTENISRTPNIKLCESCHDDSIIQRISYDGRIHAGGH